MTPATGLLVLTLSLNAVTAMSAQRTQVVDDLQVEGIKQQTPTGIAKKTPSTLTLEDALVVSNEVGNRAMYEEEQLSGHFMKQRSIRARRSASRSPKRFGFSFGSGISPFNEAKKREVASATTTTKRPFPFWKQRTSTTKRPATRLAPLTTKRAFPRWKPAPTTARPTVAPTTKRTVFKWNRTAATTTKRPWITAKSLVPKWPQRTTTARRPTITTKRPLTTRRTAFDQPKTTGHTTTRRPTTRQTTTRRPTTKRFFFKRPTTTRRTTTRRPTTTKRPTIATRPTTSRQTPTWRPTTKRVTTRRPIIAIKRPTVAANRPTIATKRPTIPTKRPTVATKRSIPTTKRPALFSARAAKRTQVTQRPFRFTIRPSISTIKQPTTGLAALPTKRPFPRWKTSPTTARPAVVPTTPPLTTPKPTSKPETELAPKEAAGLTSLLMEIASLSPRRTVGSPSVLLALAALPTPPRHDRPAVWLHPEQKGFQLSLKHAPEGACAPCMPTFLVDLERCHPCVVIR